MKNHNIFLVAVIFSATFSTLCQAKKTITTNLNEQDHNHKVPNHLLTEVDEKHSAKNENNHQKEQLIKLNKTQQKLAGIKTQQVNLSPLSETLYAPGEIKPNGYNSYYVSPRVDSVVIKRHAVLGEKVNKGQALVTLFSESVSQAQANYRIGYADWQRVKNLPNEVVSEQQQLAAKTKLLALASQLKAYGLTEEALSRVISDEKAPLGEYSLMAARSGSVLSDEFHQGQRVESGETIMVLSDESQLWIEARLAPYNDTRLPIGTLASIEIAGKKYQAKVIQSAHTIDPITRTRIVRLLINNNDHQLHAGMFVEVIFSLLAEDLGFAVPQSALMRASDGDWQVFVEEQPNEFKATKVQLGNKVLSKAHSQQSWQEIIPIDSKSSLVIGKNVVISGAFFLASQVEKSAFDIHNH